LQITHKGDVTGPAALLVPRQLLEAPRQELLADLEDLATLLPMLARQEHLDNLLSQQLTAHLAQEPLDLQILVALAPHLVHSVNKIHKPLLRQQ
jgi:hypothetical protein